MKSKKKKPKSDNIKKYMSYFLVFVLGILVSCGVVYVTAANVIRSSEVRYDNSTSGLTSDNVQDAIEELNNNATNYSAITTRLNNMGKELYPVGSIFISVSSTNPGTFLGGTWVAFGTGRTLVGINTGDGDFNSSEKTGGSKTKTLASGNLPSHTHSIPALSGSAASAGAHTHTVSGTAASAGSHTHSVSTNAQFTVGNGQGSGASGIPAGVSGWGDHWNAHWYNISVNSGGAHTHTVSGTAASAGAHTHTVSTNASTTGATGSGSAFSTMDPYIVVYMWKRTA